MKTRVIVSVIAVPALVAVIFFAPIWAYGGVVGIIASVAAVEFLRCSEMTVKNRMLIYAAVTGFIIPVLSAFVQTGKFIAPLIFLLFGLMFCELIFSFFGDSRMDFETVAAALFAGAVMPLMFSALVRLGLRDNGRAFMLLPLISAFVCDSGAYLIGVSLGRHKLAPQLSPKKTIEGSAGGFVCTVLLMLVYGFILKSLGFEVHMPVLAIYGFLGALACQIGDLSFSAVKRIYGIKDYGNLIPGHGGMLDRFDSMVFVAPMTELLVIWVPAISSVAA